MTENDHFLPLHNYRLEVIVPFDTSKEYHNQEKRWPLLVEKRTFLLHNSRFYVTLASPKLLRLGNEKKNELFFCIPLDF